MAVQGYKISLLELKNLSQVNTVYLQAVMSCLLCDRNTNEIQNHFTLMLFL